MPSRTWSISIRPHLVIENQNQRPTADPRNEQPPGVILKEHIHTLLIPRQRKQQCPSILTFFAGFWASDEYGAEAPRATRALRAVLPPIPVAVRRKILWLASIVFGFAFGSMRASALLLRVMAVGGCDNDDL